MSIVNGSFSVTCTKCNTVNPINTDEADFDISGGEERQMGPENQYT